MENLSGIDAFWLRMDKPSNRLTITGVIRFEATLPPDALVHRLERDLQRFRRFRQRVVGHNQVLGRPAWEDDPDYSVRRHVDHIILDDGDDDDLRRLAEQLMVEPFDEARPLWSVHVIDGVGPGSTLLFRVNHGLADGFSLIFLMLSLIDDGDQVQLPGGINLPSVVPDLDEQPEAQRNRLQAARDMAQQLVRGGRELLRSPLDQTEPLRDAAQCATQLFTMSADSKTVLRGPIRGKKRVGWSRRIALSVIKEAAGAVNGTVNDLLLGALAGAFRRYLIGRGQPVDGVELRAVLPVNIRPFEQRTDALGNGFGLVFLDLPVGVTSSAARLTLLKSRMDALKNSPEAFVTYGLINAVGLLPGILLEQIIKLFEGKSTAVVTNVPGPTQPVRMFGQAIEDIIFFVPQSAGTGLGISIFSYNGSVRVGLAADADLMPDPDALLQAYHDELTELGVTHD